jgi:hypothetical protein
MIVVYNKLLLNSNCQQRDRDPLGGHPAPLNAGAPKQNTPTQSMGASREAMPRRRSVTTGEQPAAQDDSNQCAISARPATSSAFFGRGGDFHSGDGYPSELNHRANGCTWQAHLFLRSTVRLTGFISVECLG